jgi:hypothetical protein
MRQIVLSKQGGDRATGYAMSNKIVSLPEGGRVVTWIDSARQNRWALVDRGNGEILRRGKLGRPGVDNHCGAALALGHGVVHAIVGGHHSPLAHYALAPATGGEWRQVATLNVKGTYPSLACDSRGCLHLAFRSRGTSEAPGDRWTLDYCRFEGKGWTRAEPLVVADKPGYIYWTNGLAIGPENDLHLVLGNTRVLDEGALYLGASHIVSRDGGRTWEADDGTRLSLPAPAAELPLIVDDVGARQAERVQSLADQQRTAQPGPRNYNYQQMLLSNPVIDDRGAVHVVLHNGLTGTAALMTRDDHGWTARELTAVATGGNPAMRVHMQSSLSPGPDNRLYAALMIEPTEECVWGAPGTTVVRLKAKTDDGEIVTERVSDSDRTCARWLPALEHAQQAPLDHVPLLLYTKGINAGGFANNKNAVETDVVLCNWSQSVAPHPLSSAGEGST